MKTPPLMRVLAAPLLILALNASARADSTTPPTSCKDGTTSSATGRGACSGHGGVQKASGTAASTAGSSAAPAAPAPPAASAPAATPAPAGAASTVKPAAAPAAAAAPAKAASTTGNTDPTGATAKCKDGTYSKSKHHSGTCSRHGGVEQWLDGSH